MTEASKRPKKLKIPHSKRVIARVVIELTAPMSISTGELGAVADNALVCDANGLPTIPGASLAGVLRSVWLPGDMRLAEDDPIGDDDDKTGIAFGFQEATDDDTEPPGRRSLVRVSWGAIHDATDRPVTALMTQRALRADPVLEAALVPVVRDHVRIDHRGTANDTGKFTRASVMMGHRFTIELETSGDQAEALMQAQVEALASAQTRLGGRSRAGLGAFKLLSAQQRVYDLSTRDGLADWTTRSIDLSERLMGAVSMPWQTDAPAELELRLKATEPWHVGAGDGAGLDGAVNTPPKDDPQAVHYSPDILPYTERRIVWQNKEGHVSAPQLVLPAASIKGALRHRTAFHLQCRTGGAIAPSADGSSVEDPLQETDTLPGIEALFGTIKRSSKRHGKESGEETERGQVGLLFIEDVRLPVRGLLSTTHVSLDRFTGGPLAGHLFTEISVDDSTRFSLSMQLRSADGREIKISSELGDALRALRAAIEDLLNDGLQLGGGAGRGYGYFEGTVDKAPAWYRDAGEQHAV